MFLRMDYIKAEVKKKLKIGKKYKVRQEIQEGSQRSFSWDSYFFIQKFYPGHVLVRVNSKYNTSYTYQDLFDMIQNGEIR